MEGYNKHRHENNPKEKELHDTFIKEFDANTIDRIVFGTDGSGRANNNLAFDEQKIVISTIQWLGSPVGQNFLRDCGFELKE